MLLTQHKCVSRERFEYEDKINIFLINLAWFIICTVTNHIDCFDLPLLFTTHFFVVFFFPFKRLLVYQNQCSNTGRYSSFKIILCVSKYLFNTVVTTETRKCHKIYLNLCGKSQPYFQSLIKKTYHYTDLLQITDKRLITYGLSSAPHHEQDSNSQC
jgi:hypothetical protein